MSKLDELIVKFCPNGVEYKKISDVVVSLKTGLNPRKNFTLNADGAECFYITGKDVYGDKINVSDRTDKISKDVVELINKRAQLHDDVLLFVSTGTGTVGRMTVVEEYTGDWNVSETMYIITVKPDELLTKYLFYTLYSTGAKMQYEPKISKGSVPHLKVVDLMGVKIPVPPLEVQREIVHILDEFTLLSTELSTELSAELQARKKQYEYYRDTLLEFDNKIPMVTLKDIATEIYRGSGIKRDQVTEEGIPCVRYGEIYTTYNTWFKDCVSHTKEEYVSSPKYFEYGDILFAITGESVEDIAKSVAYLGNEKCLAGGDIVVLKHKQNPRYLAHVLSTTYARQQKSKGKVKSKVVHSNVPSIESITIPLPSLEVQERYADVLDNFETICNDLSIGLPAEIDARQKQYEYYRDALLTFAETGDSILTDRQTDRQTDRA